MSAIRLLVLGVLMSKNEIHGYEIRRELESWNAEKWANIAYGSIYFALKKLAEEKLVEPLATNETAPARILYKITDSGKEEFMRLLRAQWWEPKSIIDPFQVALTFMNYLPNDELILALETKSDYLKTIINSFEKGVPMRISSQNFPRHITENFRLAVAHLRAEAEWIQGTIQKIKAGELP